MGDATVGVQDREVLPGVAAAVDQRGAGGGLHVGPDAGLSEFFARIVRNAPKANSVMKTSKAVEPRIGDTKMLPNPIAVMMPASSQKMACQLP